MMKRATYKTSCLKACFLLFQPARKCKEIAIHRLNEPTFRRVRGSNLNAFDYLDGNESGDGMSSDEEDTVLQVIHDVLERDVQGIDEVDDSDEVNASAETETKKEKVRRWRKRDFQPDNQQFSLQFDTPTELKTPVEYFKTFYSDQIFEKMADETNRYFYQEKAPQLLGTNPKEIEMLVGMLLKMGVVEMPNIRDYFAKETLYEPVASVMSRNRFQQLCRYLHFVDNTDDSVDKSDKTWKVKPFLDILRENFLKVTPEEYQAVDEISIAYKGQKGPRQYNPRKPHKWHFTVHARAGSSGFVYDFQVYTGSRNEIPSECGVSGDHVLRLCESLPTGSPFKIFADNYFVSLPLVDKLKEKGFHFTGTFRLNRIPINFESDKCLKAQGRGSSDHKVNEDGDVIAVKWFDNRSVHLISTYAGVDESKQIQRYDRKSKEYTSIACPEIVTEYNSFMGGIDLMDSLVSLYKYKFRSIRWPMFIWHHMTHLALVNGWLLYRREASQMRLSVSLLI